VIDTAETGDPIYREIVEYLPPGTKPADFVTSLDLAARKPLA
jgi:hypothetical protein